MAQQAPWDAAPVVRQRVDPRQNEREQAETRYRNTTGDTNPLAQPPILPGEQGYAGPGEYLPQAGVVVRGAWDNAPVQTESQKRAAAEAERRYGGDRSLNTLAQGPTANFLDEGVGRLAQAEQMAVNLGRRLTGQPIEIESRDLNDAVVETIRGGTDAFAREKPVASFGLMALGAIPAGGAALGRGIGGAALTGGAYGTAAAAGAAEGGFVDRLPEAALGGGVGAVAGGALGAATPFAQRLGSIASAGTRPIREAAGALVGRRQEPGVVASRRLADQARRSGVDVPAAQARAAEFRAAGLEPSVVDVGGQNLRATVRAAGSGEGAGRERAVQYAEGIRSSVAPRAIERARRLTPDNRDALQTARDLTGARRTEANTLYRDAYDQEITVPVEIVGALRGPEGAAAIREARRIASLERDDAAVSALDNLAVADYDQAVTANGRALDYVRQAYSDLARDAEGNLGAALQGRVDEIEGGLNLIPELQEARRAYRSASEQIDAVGGVPDRLGRQRLGRPERAPQPALTTDASRYGAYVEGLSPEAQAANQTYQRDQIVRNLGQSVDGAVGPLNRLSAGSNLPVGPNSPVVARNLEATFPGQGQQFQRDIRLAREQVTGANYIDPNTGSPTAARLQDAAAEGAQAAANVATGGKAALVRMGFDNVVRRLGLNEAEREAIVSLGIGSADDFERIVRLADASRQAGRPIPREVRAYVVNARNVLGSRSPVPQQLEQLLIPSRVVAEEQEP